MVGLIVLTSQTAYAEVWEKHYDQLIYNVADHKFKFSGKYFYRPTDTYDNIGYFGGVNKGDPFEKEVYILDRNVHSRDDEKIIKLSLATNILTWGNPTYYYSGEDMIQDILTYKFSIFAERTVNNYKNARILSSAPYQEGSADDSLGGIFNFLSRNVKIESTQTTLLSNVDPYVNSSEEMIILSAPRVGNSLVGVYVDGGGGVSFLDKQDFTEYYKNFCDDLEGNGADNVDIVINNIITKNTNSSITQNVGYAVRGVDVRDGSFSLHSNKFKIEVTNNSVSPFGLDDAIDPSTKEKITYKSSAAAVALYSQGGVVSLRSKDNGEISATTTEDAFEPDADISEHNSESFGLFISTRYDGIVERDENGEVIVNKGKDEKNELKRVDITGSSVDFDFGVYEINSKSRDDSSYGVFSIGSNNLINFSGNVTINSISSANARNQNDPDANAYGIVNVALKTTVEKTVVEPNAHGGKEPGHPYKFEPILIYDKGSKIILNENARLELSVDSTTGNAYGLLQVGESSSIFDGDVKISINSPENEKFKGEFNDAYGILVSGDEREENELTSDGRRVVVNNDLSVNVNDFAKTNRLAKARAIEALGNSIVDVNVNNGRGSLSVDGDLHTSKSFIDVENHDQGIQIPDNNHLAISINILSWAYRSQKEEARFIRNKLVSNNYDATQDSSSTPNYLGEGRINFVMNQKDSFLVGAANGNIDMEVGAGTLWSVTDDSIFENLRPTGGTIDLHHPDDEWKWNEANPYQYLMVKNITDEAYPLLNGARTAAPAENSLFILNTNIMGDLEKDGKRVFSFDGITYYEKAEGDGAIKNGTLTGDTFSENGSYIFNGQSVPIELKGFEVTEAAARMRHDIRFGDFLDFRTETSKAQEPKEQHYRVRINDETIADGSIDYQGRVLKFATTPAHVKLSGDWTSLDYTAFKYKPKIWKTEHTDKYVDAAGTLSTRPESVLNEQGEIQEAVNSTLFERDDYDKVVEGLESTESDPDALDISTGMTDYWVSGYTKEINDPGKTTTAIAGISFNPIYLSTLRKRLGEVRYGAQDGLWAKAMMMKDSVGGIASKGYDQDLYGVSFGYDHFVRNTEEGLWLLGANIRQAHAKQDLMDGQGSGKTDAIGLNAYATWANYQGAYADFVLSADHYRQKLSTVGEHGKITGKYNTLGWGASIEVGHMFHSTRNDLSWGPWYNSWWLEPQLQLAFYRVEGEKYTLSSGGRIRQKDADSLIGRAGIVIGKKFNYGEDREEIDRRYSQLYLKAGVKHDFLGDRTVWFGSDRFDGEVAGKTTFYYGLGGDWQFNERMRLYGQFERETGDDYEKDYEVSVGLKYEF